MIPGVKCSRCMGGALAGRDEADIWSDMLDGLGYIINRRLPQDMNCTRTQHVLSFAFYPRQLDYLSLTR